MNNFFGFQGGTSNSSQGNNKPKSSFMDKFSSAVSQIGQSVSGTANYSNMSTEELHANGYKALNNNQIEKALAMFIEGATRYDLNCCIQLNNMYRCGVGVPEDPFQAWFWGRMCAELGAPFGYYTSGCDYYFGTGVDEDDVKGFAYFEKAYRMGYEDAKPNLDEDIERHIEWYDNGGGCSVEEIKRQIELNRNNNPEEYYDYCLRLASFDSDNDGKNWVGLCCFKGEGVEQDYIAAYYWFKKAADHGNIFAYYNLANMYATGTGVLLDYEEAIRLYNIAASKGHTTAANRAQLLTKRLHTQFDLWLNEYNNHMQYDLNSNKSFSMLNHIHRYGALKNDVVCCAEHASLCLWGDISVDRDYHEALFYAAKAVLGLKNTYTNIDGIGFAYYMLSHIFATGKGVPADREKAAYFFDLARTHSADYSSFYDVYQYMSTSYNQMASKNDYYKALADEKGENGDSNHAEALRIFDELSANKYLPAVFKAIRYYQKSSFAKYDDAMIEKYWQIIKNIIDNSQNKDKDWAYIVSEVAGIILDEYNSSEVAAYDYLTGQMAVDIGKIIYRKGKRNLAYIAFIIARERGYNNPDAIWHELEAERKSLEASSVSNNASKNISKETIVEIVGAKSESDIQWVDDVVIDDSALFQSNDENDDIEAEEYMDEASEVKIETLQQSEQECMPNNLDKYFANMIGMKPVKEQLEKIYQSVKMQLLRNKILEERGEEVVDSGKGYNFILLGNPGTGKTTVARIIAQILYDINVRQSNSFIEIERSGVVSDHVGGTEKRMREILDKVEGGTLFIDEAYALYKEDSDNDFGREAIDVLMKDMEDKRNSYSVIMAGYREPMLNMIKNANSGFSSRFTYTIELPDYTDESLIEIAHMHIDKQKFTTDDKVDDAIKKCIVHDKIDHTFGNARYIRELVNRAIENQSHRLSNQSSYENDELFLLKAEDFWQGEYEEEGVDKYLNELKALTGLESVKQEVESLINLITVQQEMERRGIENAMDYGTLHMAFKGNPGTGKTTVARIIGKLYASLGILKRGDVFVECTRADLVGKFQGHTAANVKKVVDSAMGGILFIDEAYSLCQNKNDSFGHEAVDALVAEIENNRKNFVVIFAGYTDDIDEFFKNNSGLRSRVPKDLIFEDYNLEELYKIATSMIASKKLILAKDAAAALINCLEQNYKNKDFGNARGVRNIIEAINRKQNVRIAQLLRSNPTEITDEILLTLEAEDINNITV